MDDEIFESDIYTLTDEEGNEADYELIGSISEGDVVYYALIPCADSGKKDEEEYIVLRCEEDENGEEVLVSIDDDEEFDRIADIFDDEFADINYDDGEEEADGE